MTTNESQPRILVIVPCHNEETRIGPVVRAVRAALPGADVVVVNDESADDTARDAAEAGAFVLSHAVNLGYGAALETGYLYALDHGYHMVAQMDGDGQHPASELPRLIGPILDGQADLVIGSRYLDKARPFHGSIPRRLGQLLFGLIARLATGRRFSDPTSGFQALDTAALRFLSSGILPYDYPDADVLIMAHQAGLRIAEVPVTMLPRTDGQSMHAGLKPIYYVAKMLLSVFVVLLNRGSLRRYRKHAV